jgi:uncharacterized membrane protein YphA (DoxX/SURF4 family)
MSKKVTMVLSLILGLVLLVFGLNKFFNFMPMQMEGEAAEFMGTLGKAGYFQILGVLEIFIGLLLITKKWTGFALVLLAPLAVNFLIFHFNYNIAGIGGAALVSILTIALIYANWGRFKSLF